MVTDRLNGDELTNACAASAVRGRPPNFDLENISTAVNVVSDISDVPLPSTWAMMLAGIAVLGFAGYCKARKGAAFAA